jgi:hypothetical protein
VRPPPPAKLGAGPRHLGRAQPSWARNQQESGCVKLQAMVTIQIDSNGVYIIKRRKVTLIKNVQLLLFCK